MKIHLIQLDVIRKIFGEIFGVSLAKNADLTKPKWKMMS